MPTSRTRMASRFKSVESALKIEESEAEIDAVKVESVIGMAFASRFRMFVRKAFAVQSSGSVRTMPMFAGFTFLFLCILFFVRFFQAIEGILNLHQIRTKLLKRRKFI